jgi:tRNA(fMet)-specific endonuclease VapC
VARVLLDTDIFSEVLKGKNPTVLARATEHIRADGPLVISAIAVMEVVKGLHKAGREAAVERFLGGLGQVEIIPFGTKEAALAGRIYGDLERSGQTIGRADPMVAAIAIFHGLPLATGNHSHYKRIQDGGYDLALEDWRTPG